MVFILNHEISDIPKFAMSYEEKFTTIVSSKVLYSRPERTISRLKMEEYMALKNGKKSQDNKAF